MSKKFSIWNSPNGSRLGSELCGTWITCAGSSFEAQSLFRSTLLNGRFSDGSNCRFFLKNPFTKAIDRLPHNLQHRRWKVLLNGEPRPGIRRKRMRLGGKCSNAWNFRRIEWRVFIVCIWLWFGRHRSLLRSFSPPLCEWSGCFPAACYSILCTLEFVCSTLKLFLFVSCSGFCSGFC